MAPSWAAASTLFAASTTARPPRRKIREISMSSAVGPSRVSTTNTTRSASSTAASTWRRTPSIKGSSDEGSKPPVSTTVACHRSKLTRP